MICPIARAITTNAAPIRKISSHSNVENPLSSRERRPMSVVRGESDREDQPQDHQDRQQHDVHVITAVILAGQGSFGA